MDFFGTILQVIFVSILVLAFGMFAMNNPGWVLFVTGWGTAGLLIYSSIPKNRNDDGKVWK